jgi:putative hemolysin
MSSTLTALAVLALLVLVAFFAMAETSLTRMTRLRAGTLADEKRRGADALTRLVNHPERFLNPLLLMILACHFAISTLVAMLVKSSIPGWATAIVVFAEVIIVFIFTEAGPKTWAIQHTDRAALLVAPFVGAIVRFPLLQVLARGLISFTNAVLPGKGLKHGPATSEQELLAMADAALDEGVIEKDERSMIHSTIEFGDTVVREVMKPRPDMVTVEAADSVDEAMTVAIKAGFSRIPVIRESKDDIAGIIYAKDLMRALKDGKQNQPVAAIIRPARFCPESKKVSELMREMQTQKFHLAIVLDEYGGTAGLVTLEDLIEEIIGEIVDEYDVEDPQIERLPNGDVRVTASMLIDELNELLDVDWPSEDWDTIGGLVFNKLGHVPLEGETILFEGHQLRAERVKGRRIGRVRIARLPDAGHDSDEDL